MAHQSTRRDFVKKAAYATPAILTLKATPAFAAHGSAGPEYGDGGGGNGGRCRRGQRRRRR